MTAGTSGPFDHLWRSLALDDTLPPDATHRAPAGSVHPGSAEPAPLPQIALAPLGTASPGDADLCETRVLGEGGMGVVMLAHQRSLDREVAVKVARPEVLDATVVAALLTEGRITGALEHPGIVPIHALGRDPNGRAVLVMKRVSGVVWRDLLRDATHPAWARFPGDRLAFNLEILRRVCDAVHFAHSRAVVHRDLKTENVMIGDFGEVYVLDWGIALRLADRDGSPRVVGTPAFMAPEMLTGNPGDVTPQTDVYLLGGILHELLTGTSRHGGSNLYQVAFKAFQSEPYAYPDTVPEALAALCNRATAPDPAHRPESARAFRDALTAYETHRASERLIDAAVARVAALRAVLDQGPAGDHARAVQLYVECTFAFRQVRASWADNPRAAQRQQEADVLMARHELARRDVDAAAAVMATMDPVPPDLAGELQALRAARDAEAREITRLHGVVHDLDPRVAARERAVAAVVTAVLSGVIPLTLSELQRHEAVQLTYSRVTVVTLAVTAGGAATTWAYRRTLLSNRASRQLMAMPFVGLAGVMACMAAGALRGAPMADVAVHGLLVVGVMFACAAVMHDRRLLAVAALIVAAAMVGAWDPARVFDVVSAAGVLSGLGSAAVFRTLARDDTAVP